MKKVLLILGLLLNVAHFSYAEEMHTDVHTADLEFLFDDVQLDVTVQNAPKEESLSVLKLPVLAVGYLYYTHIKPTVVNLVTAVLATDKARAQVEGQ